MIRPMFYGVPAFLSLALFGTLLGCSDSLSPVVSVPATPPPSAAFSGRVTGNNQPVSGASLQLYAASSAGYGAKSIALLSKPALTDASGSFTITGYYRCPSATSQVYLTAAGGSAGAASATGNGALALAAAMGNCGDLSGSTTVTLNELTTIAAVWPLAQFMSGLSSVGTSATNLAGLRTAFLNSARLVNSTTGALVPSDPASPTTVQTIVPGNELNTLANVLAACVGSSGSTAAGTPCGTLFTAAAAAGGAVPTETVGAALSMALHPLAQVGVLYGLTSAASPFTPGLTAVPVDWLLPLTYQYNDIYSGPAALDGSGNFWMVGSSSMHSFVAGYGQTTQAFHNRLLVEPVALAADQNRNVWIIQGYTANNGLFEFSPADSTLPCGSLCGPFVGGGLSNPVALAVDAHGNVWVRK